MEGSAIVGSMTSQRVAFGGSETINVSARDESGGKTKRLPRRRDSIRAKSGVKWTENEDWLRQWAPKCTFAEASAIRSVADLRVEVGDDLPTLGCFWPIVWAEQRAYTYMGGDSDIEEHYLCGRFGQFSWDATLPRDDALIRSKEAVNMLHMGDVPDEMAGTQPESFLHGSVGSVVPFPAITEVSCPVVGGRRLWP